MIRPINDYVLVKLKKTKVVTGDDQIGAYQTGTVEAIGNLVEHELEGHVIMWEQYAESKVFELDGESYTFVKYESIMGVE